MSDFYIGEIRAFACNFAPQGWAFCDGSLLQIQTNAALYSLLGIQYGGDGVKNFALPDLRGRVPIGAGVRAVQSSYSYSVGNKGGSDIVALTIPAIPVHSHLFLVKNAAGTAPLANAVLAIPESGTTQFNIYNTAATSSTTLNPTTIQPAGTGAAHNNMQPFQTINFCIAIEGYYPTRP
jgi:microcystin-dependent protein